jgi:hypothetical protein
MLAAIDEVYACRHQKCVRAPAHRTHKCRLELALVAGFHREYLQPGAVTCGLRLPHLEFGVTLIRTTTQQDGHEPRLRDHFA